MLGGIAAILAGGCALKTKDRHGAAIAVLAILAAPAVLFGLFVLSFIILQPDWR